ncbi:MAG: hypothetical protein JWN11_410 [Hyphomicrobiales bacterium]|nr:hypothetical protein [Hyphomicrobiales bacterium]
MPRLIAVLIAAQVAAWERRLDRLGQILNPTTTSKKGKSK